MTGRQLLTEDVIAQLKANGWSRKKTAKKLRVHAATIFKHVRDAREMGITIEIDPDDPNPNHPRHTGSLQIPPEYHIDPDRLPISSISPDPELVEEAGNTYGGRLDVMLASKNFEGARAVIDEAERAARCVDSPIEILKVPLSEVGVPVRTTNALECKKVHQVGDLAKIQAESLLALPNFGLRSLDVVWWSILKLAAQRDVMRQLLEMRVKELGSVGRPGAKS